MQPSGGGEANDAAPLLPSAAAYDVRAKLVDQQATLPSFRSTGPPFLPFLLGCLKHPTA